MICYICEKTYKGRSYINGKCCKECYIIWITNCYDISSILQN